MNVLFIITSVIVLFIIIYFKYYKNNTNEKVSNFKIHINAMNKDELLQIIQTESDKKLIKQAEYQLSRFGLKEIEKYKKINSL